jgi:hypothetical protein
MPESAYTFPFATCEPVGDGPRWIAQPWSFAINGVTAIALLAFAFKTPSAIVRAAILSYAAFEGWHAFSHARHVPGNVQRDVVHALGYAMAFSTLAAILYLSGTSLSLAAAAAICAAVLLDIALVWRFHSTIVMIFTGLLIFSVILVTQWNKLPPAFYAAFGWMLIGVIALMGLFINEYYRCARMLEVARAPWHAMIELLGFALFVALAWNMHAWDRAVAEAAGQDS